VRNSMILTEEKTYVCNRSNDPKHGRYDEKCRGHGKIYQSYDGNRRKNTWT
jgi:hypothetical protein